MESLSLLELDIAVALVNAVPAAVVCADPAGRVAYSNEAAKTFVGRDRLTVGAPIHAVLPEWNSFTSALDRSRVIEAEIIPPSGDPQRVELSLFRIARGGRVLVGAFISSIADVSGQKVLEAIKAEAAQALDGARVAERRMREIIEMLPQAVCVFDAQDRYLLWNQKYAQTYPEIAHLLAPGAPFVDILRASLSSGQQREFVDEPETWLNHRLARHALPVSREEQELRGGHWLLHDDRRLADGGAIGMRIDITDLKRREASFRLLFQSNPVPMLMLEPETLQIVDVNEAAIDLYAYSREQFLAMSEPDLHLAEEAELARNTFGSIADHYTGRTVWRHRTRGDDEVHVLVFVRALMHENRPSLVTAIADVSDRVRAEAQISHLAHHDTLTGLANRIHFHKALEGALAKSSADRRVAVHCLDLDGFKAVNDSFGHTGGDRLLQMVAARLQTAVRDGDLVARLGGDEFAVLQQIASDSPDILAARLIATIRQPFRMDGCSVEIGVSVGFAVGAADSVDVDQFLTIADHALYQAKRAGKNTWRGSEDAQSRHVMERLHVWPVGADTALRQEPPAAFVPGGTRAGVLIKRVS